LNPFLGFINQLTMYIPNILAAILLAVIAHIIGKLVKSLITNLLSSHKLQEKAGRLTSYRDTLGKIGYALVILLFAPAILDTLHIAAIAGPVGNIINLIINYLPLFIGAIIIIVVGHYIAKFVANLVETLVIPLRLERWTGANVNAAHLIRSIVYFLIIFPIAVQALNMLQIESIQQPAEQILNLVMFWIPKIIIAAFLIYIGYIIAKIVRNLAITLISPLNINEKLQGLYPRKKESSLPTAYNIPPAEESGAIKLDTYPITRWIANLIGVLVFGFFLVEATNLLGLGFISTTVAYLMALLPRLVLVAIIILAGKALAMLAERMMKDSNPMKRFISPLIMVLAFVIGLTEIGIASIIITSGFMIILGALAVTFIIAVGIGSIPAVKTYWENKQNRPRI
jgi:VanZ family protein